MAVLAMSAARAPLVAHEAEGERRRNNRRTRALRRGREEYVDESGSTQMKDVMAIYGEERTLNFDNSEQSEDAAVEDQTQSFKALFKGTKQMSLLFTFS